MPSKTKELLRAIDEIRSKIPPGTTWKHYKGGIYKVNDYVIDTDNGGVRIQYNRIEGPDYNYGEGDIFFVRPAEEWFTFVETTPSIFVPRFQRVQKVARWHTEDEIKQLQSARVV